jgi:histidinol-phosphatase (PHP family)
MEKQFSSLHTHTVFCVGKDDVATMCRTAYEEGLAAVGFSSHAPVEKTGLESNWNMKEDRLAAYIDEVCAARRRWEGKIAVYLGLELDYIKGLRSALDRDIKGLDVDYLIGSVHFLIPPRGAPFTVDGPVEELEKGITEGFGGDGEAMMNAYWDTVAEMIALGGIDIVGHLDLVKKSNGGRWFNTESSAYMQRANEVSRSISTAGLVVEVNTGGINRGYLAETYPSTSILRLLRQHNVPAMISADAHRADDLNGHYQEARQTLLDAGYTSHVLFKGKNNGKSIWCEQPLQ